MPQLRGREVSWHTLLTYANTGELAVLPICLRWATGLLRDLVKKQENNHDMPRFRVASCA